MTGVSIPSAVILHDLPSGRVYHSTVHYVYEGEELPEDIAEKAVLVVELLKDGRTGSVNSGRPDVHVTSGLMVTNDQSGQLELHVEGVFQQKPPRNPTSRRVPHDIFNEFFQRNDRIRSTLFSEDVERLFFALRPDSPDLGVQPPSVLFGGTPTTSIPRRHSSITAPGSIANIPPGPAGVWPAKSNTPPLSNEPSVAAPVHQSYPRGPGTREPTYAAPQLHSQQQQITTDQMYPVDEHLSQELRRTSISKSPDRLESTPQTQPSTPSTTLEPPIMGGALVTGEEGSSLTGNLPFHRIASLQSENHIPIRRTNSVEIKNATAGSDPSMENMLSTRRSGNLVAHPPPFSGRLLHSNVNLSPGSGSEAVPNSVAQQQMELNRKMELIRKLQAEVSQQYMSQGSGSPRGRSIPSLDYLHQSQSHMAFKPPSPNASHQRLFQSPAFTEFGRPGSDIATKNSPTNTRTPRADPNH